MLQMHENETSLRKWSDGIEHRWGSIGDAYTTIAVRGRP